VVVVLRSDGRFLARSRDWERHMGESVLPDRPFLQPGAAESGTFRAPASLDRTPRVFAWRRLPDTGLIVAIGLDEAALLAPLRKSAARQQWQNGTVALIMLLLGGGTVLLLMRQARNQRQLALNEERYRRLHESMMDAYVQTDLAGRLVEWNRAYESMLGYTTEQLRAQTSQSLTPSRWHDEESRIVAEQVLPRGYSEVYEKEYLRSDGTLFPVEVRTFLMRDDTGGPIGMWAIVRDITERKLVEARIQHLAHHDALTGLPNRAALNLQLNQAIASAHRSDDHIAVLIIDLDRFKSINDNLGHLVGDRMLIEVAQRLRASVRESDIVTRLGGDEFIVVLTDIADTATVQAVGKAPSNYHENTTARPLPECASAPPRPAGLRPMFHTITSCAPRRCWRVPA